MLVNSYSFGNITIDGKKYNRDVILLPDEVWDGWWRQEGHSLSVADLERVLAVRPEVLIVGTGYFGLMRVPDATRAEVERRGIELHVVPTRQAWQIYNRLSASGRRVAAALHLSC